MRLCADCTRKRGLPIGVGAYSAIYQTCADCQQPRSTYSLAEFQQSAPKSDDSFNLLGTVLSAGVDITLGIVDVATDSGSSFGGGGGFSGGGSSGDF